MYLGHLIVLLGLSLLFTVLDLSDLRAASHRCISEDSFEVWHDDTGGWVQNSVTAVVQTHDGYLWLGTYHGLVRFDGVSFTVFDSSNSPELPNGRITSLYEGPDRVLWIGHETGHLSRNANSRFQSVKLSTNWPGGVIESITSDEQGDVWLLNDSGLLLRVTDGKTTSTPGGASALRKATMARARHGKLWVTSNGQVSRLEQGRVVPVEFPENQGTNFFERVFPSADGGLWVLGDGRVRKWREGAWRGEIEAVPSSPGAINALVETQFGLLAGTMREGLYLLRFGAKPLHFSRAEGLSHDWVRALLVDREGNCWVGTGAGFNGFRPRKVRMLTPPDSWRGCVVRSFIVSGDDVAWVGTEGGGLYHYDGERWNVFDEANGILSRFVWSVLETKQHELFVGTWGGGLFRRKGEGFESFGDLGKITAPVTALYQGRGGELWIGTKEGLHRYESGKLVWFAGEDKLVVPDVRAITESADGTLWFGMSGGGLGSLHEGALKQFRQADGLSSDLVSCLYADPDGSLWIGTADNGLTRLAHGKFSIVSTAQGLSSRIISHMVDDAAGHLLMGSLNGIFRVNIDELRRCADGETSSVHCLRYGRAEGLTTQSCPGGFQPGACKTRDGRLWFPTVNGLAVVDPVTTNSIVPPVIIEALYLDGLAASNWLSGVQREPIQSSSLLVHAAPLMVVKGVEVDAPDDTRPLRIPPGHRRFEFHYTGLSFVAPDKVRFRRMLQGMEHDWVDAGVKRVAEYSFLPPGNYTFKVCACNNDDVWNEAGASVAFTVLPFFWQTLWFRGASTLAGAGALAGSVVWSVRRRLQRKLELSERQRALERERARIARDIHDDLGASLTRITMLSQSVRSDVQNQPEAAAEVDQIHSTAREITRAMDEIVWAVNPKYDTLDSLAAYLSRYAQQYLSSVNIRCRLKVPLQLPALALSAEVRHNVFLAFKETLNNTVKHARATEVFISLELRPAGFVLLVGDNGRGFHWDPAGPQAAGSGDGLRAAAGNGLANIQKRLEEIGGRCDWDTAPGKGTRVTLAVEVKEWTPNA